MVTYVESAQNAIEVNWVKLEKVLKTKTKIYGKQKELLED